MFDDYIREQGSDEYIIRSAIRMYGWSGRVETKSYIRCCNMNRFPGDDDAWDIVVLQASPASCKSFRWGDDDGE